MELDVYFESVVTAQPILGGIESLHGYIFFKKALMGGVKIVAWEINWYF